MFGLPFGRRRYVIVIGDDGAVMSHVVGRSVRKRLYAPGPTSDAARTMIATLREEPNTAVYVLIDVLEQHYREVDIPNVSPLDRPKIIRRKLALAFPDDPLTGSMPTMAEEGATEKRSLFVGVPRHKELELWINMLTAAGNPVDGISLLPVEAVRLAETLRSTAPKAEDQQRQWRLLLSRQRTGGFRQVIIQNRKLVFTRLTPSLPSDVPTAEVVENIEREFASTVSYLRRLSFSEADRIELTIIANPDVCAELDPRRLRIRQVRSLTPAQAASQIGLDQVADEEDGFADVLYAAWFAQRRPVMKLNGPEVLQTQLANRLPRAAVAASVAITLGGAALGAKMYTDGLELAATLESDRRTLGSLREEADQRAADMERLSVDPDRLRFVVEIFKDLEASRPKLAAPLGAVARALDPSTVRLSKVQAAMTEFSGDIASLRFQPVDRRGRAARDERAEAMTDTLTITVELAGFSSRQEARLRFNAFVDDTRAGMPDGYTVSVDLEPFSQATLRGRAGVGAAPSEEDLPETVTGQISIIGRPETT